MQHHGIAENILDLVLRLTSFGTLLCALLLYLRRGCGDRSRVLLMLVCAVTGLMFLLRIMGENYELLQRAVLPASNLKGGLLLILFYLLYPIEVIRPGWLDFKRALVLFSPWILLEVLFACVPDFRPLTSFPELIQHAGEFNVWMRLLVLALIPFINFILFYIPHSWARSSADNRWIRWYTCGSCGIAVLYTLFMLTGSAAVSAVHVAYCLLFGLVVTYQELFLRMRVPVEAAEEETEEELPQAAPAAQETTAPALDTSPTSGCNPASAAPLCLTQPNPLWNALMRLMDEEELWRNPDLKLETLAVRLDSNRTTLAQMIRQHGYEDYRHFINRHRIGEFLKIAENDPRISIQDTFFRVGFRSKNTALRYFHKETGTTPSDYLLRLPKRK